MLRSGYSILSVMVKRFKLSKTNKNGNQKLSKNDYGKCLCRKYNEKIRQRKQKEKSMPLTIYKQG